MRKRFGNWGAGLSDADFACALAAAGALESTAEPSWTAERLAEELRNRFEKHGGQVTWSFSERTFLFDARILAQAWLFFRESVPPGASLVFDSESIQRSEIDPFWLEFTLLRAAGREVQEARPRRIAIEDSLGTTDPATRGSYSVREPEEGYRPVAGEAGREPRPRYLQARLRSGRAWHQVHVRIGLPDREWAAVDEPFPDPSEPPESEGHRLTVIFWEPRVSPEARIEHLWLPPEGSSEAVSFSFERPEGVHEIAARITVLHNNRVLQTGLLRASLAERRSGTFTLDATPRTHLEGLADRGRFDLALVLNHDTQGIPRMTAVADDRATVIPVGESAVEALTRALGDQISRIAERPERYETLQSEGTEELLRTLAQHGGLLHQYLSGFEMLGRLEAANGPQPRIHLTAARPDSFFPVELLYRFEVPEDTAKLCSHALTALAQGACTAECPSEKSETVCPLGFWGMCRVIERHNHRRVEKRPQTGFDLRPEPIRPRSRLDISGKALVAASDAASRHDADAVETLLDALRRRGPAEEVKSWKDWRTRVAADHPKLLVLLPHHERKDGFEVLEIGAADALKFVKPEHVDPGSIVLLMGCETNLAKIAFDSFVIQFILHGAAIVVSTIATILGRHASPATARLVELLDEEAREEDSTFGEVMLRLRQKLVAEQTPMALGLTAYGDADWILTRKE